MTTHVELRALTSDEKAALESLSNSRKAPVRLVERARIIKAASEEASITSGSEDVGVSRHIVYDWIKRFNEKGIAGLGDAPRSGRPVIYTPEQVAEVIATALTPPKDLGLEFGCWTLDRLETYLNEERGIAIKRSRIDTILLDEGLRWRKQETWFGERVDPDFAEKRGPSSSCTRKRPSIRLSSASTKWGRNPPRASRGARS